MPDSEIIIRVKEVPDGSRLEVWRDGKLTTVVEGEPGQWSERDDVWLCLILDAVKADLKKILYGHHYYRMGKGRK